MKKNMTLLSSNKKNMLHVAVWRPDGQPKAVIQIVHGMVEYIERYSDFAEYLTQNGFLVIGHDHLGHGQSVQSVEDWGYIGDDHPSDTLTRDIHRVRRLGERLAPGLPYFILGHSMGSYLLRKAGSRYHGDRCGAGFRYHAGTAACPLHGKDQRMASPQ